MEPLDYRQQIVAALQTEAQYHPQSATIEVCTLIDTVNDHYQLLYLGWEGDQRILSVIAHLRLIAGKIHIEHDGTPDGIAATLEQAGVPKDAIVLAFHPPYKRPLTAYAIA
jgi:hypothetical protein